MISYYEQHRPKLFLYVNNGRSNFQTLSYAPALHVHINHGESDKLSMVSNQAKAYDAVFTAGPAALRRHRRALIDESPIASAVPVIDANTVDTLPAMIADALANGGDKDERAQARALYFGDYGVGESRVAFIETVQKLIAEREEKLKHFDVQPTAAETADEPEN